MTPPCPPAVVTFADRIPTCDLNGSQTWVVVGLDTDGCLDAGGRPIVILGVPFCVGVDY